MNPGDTIYDVSLGMLEPMTVVEISVTAGGKSDSCKIRV